MEDEEVIILSSKANLEYLGFAKAKDPFKLLSKVFLILFIALFFIVIVDAFSNKGIFSGIFLILCFCIMFMCIVLGFGLVYIPRFCPKCRRRMRRINPDGKDTKHSHKHYCGYCRIYIDTETYNTFD